MLELLDKDSAFPYQYELLDVLSEMASESLCGAAVEIGDFWNIQRLDECISVAEIEQWSLNTPSSGFVFHALVRLTESRANHQCNDESAKYFFRRQLLYLGGSQGTGFEVFLSQDGSLSLAAITKKDYHVVTCAEAKLFDNRWHTVTVAVVPSKRPFSYFNVSIYRDGETLLSTSLKVGTSHEKFSICSIGAPPRMNRSAETDEQQNEQPVAVATTGRGLFPSIFEKALPSIVSQAPTYFTLPLNRFSSNQSGNTKTVTNGLQDNIFGAPTSLQGQLASVLLADSGMQLKALFEAGVQFSSIISHESDTVEQFLRIIFCFSSTASADNLCVDLSGGRKLSGVTTAKNIHTVSLQNALHSIGGVTSLLPVLEYSMAGDSGEVDLQSLTSDLPLSRVIQNPVAYFLVILRYVVNDKRLIQECAAFVPLMNVVIQSCDPQYLDVQVLMAMQILIENLVQHQMFQQKDAVSAGDAQLVNQFVDHFYEHLVFNLRIWSRAAFQIIIGHIQYLQTLIKSDRKRFRKKYGVQFLLDTIRQYFIAPSNITESDAHSIRVALLDVVKVYIQKEVNIKEVGCFLSFLAATKHEQSLVEVLDLWTHHMEANCKDQMFLLLLEPQTAELVYCLLIDRNFGKALHLAVCRVSELRSRSYSKG